MHQRAVCVTAIATRNDRRPSQLHRAERLAEPPPGDRCRGDRLEHRDDRDAGRGQVAEGVDEEEEGDDRPEDDHPCDERPDGEVEGGEVSVERRADGEALARERPPRHDDRPEERGERESEGQHRGRVAGREPAFGDEEVQGIRDRGSERERDACTRHPRSSARQVDDQHEPGEREGERHPDPLPHVLAVGEAHPQGDEQGRRVLDEQRDPDREPVDGEEVEPLDEGEPADPEQGEKRQLPSADPELLRRVDGDDEEEPCRSAERADLRQAVGGDAVHQDHLRDRAVDAPEDGCGRRHRVAEVGAARRYLDGRRCLAHAHEPTVGAG